jgi:hypothetical protein
MKPLPDVFSKDLPEKNVEHLRKLSAKAIGLKL